MAETLIESQIIVQGWIQRGGFGASRPLPHCSIKSMLEEGPQSPYIKPLQNTSLVTSNQPGSIPVMSMFSLCLPPRAISHAFTIS